MPSPKQVRSFLSSYSVRTLDHLAGWLTGDIAPIPLQWKTHRVADRQ